MYDASESHNSLSIGRRIERSKEHPDVIILNKNSHNSTFEEELPLPNPVLTSPASDTERGRRPGKGGLVCVDSP